MPVTNVLSNAFGLFTTALPGPLLDFWIVFTIGVTVTLLLLGFRLVGQSMGLIAPHYDMGGFGSHGSDEGYASYSAKRSTAKKYARRYGVDEANYNARTHRANGFSVGGNKGDGWGGGSGGGLHKPHSEFSNSGYVPSGHSGRGDFLASEKD